MIFYLNNNINISLEISKLICKHLFAINLFNRYGDRSSVACPAEPSEVRE